MSRQKLFKNYTLKEKLICWLESLNFTHVDSKTGKYTVMKSSIQERYVFIGNKGAFRICKTNTASKSISCAYDKAKFESFCKSKEV